MFTSASYMLWLNDRSLRALGISTATRNCFTGSAVGAAVGALVAGAAVFATGVAGAQAVSTMPASSATVKMW